jgi:hypothetical protein
VFALGVLGKLAFWKKDDEDASFDSQFGSQFQQPFPSQQAFPSQQQIFPENQPGFQDQFGKNQASPFSSDIFNPRQDFPRAENSPFASRQMNEPSSLTPQMPHSSSLQKDMEIISAKLDALRSTLESMNQRIVNIERIANQETDQKVKYRW